MPSNDPHYTDTEATLAPSVAAPDFFYAAQDELMASFDPANWFESPDWYPIDMPEIQPDPGLGLGQDLGMAVLPADDTDFFDMQEFEAPPDFPDDPAEGLEEFDDFDTREEPCGSGGCPDHRSPQPDVFQSSDRPDVIALPTIPYEPGQGWYQPTDGGDWAVGYDSPRPRYITIDPEPEIATPVSPYKGVPVTQAHSIRES